MQNSPLPITDPHPELDQPVNPTRTGENGGVSVMGKNVMARPAALDSDNCTCVLPEPTPVQDATSRFIETRTQETALVQLAKPPTSLPVPALLQIEI